MRVLSINTGSSSLKLALHAMPGEQRLHAGHRGGLAQPEEFRAAVQAALAALPAPPEAIAHRIVAPRTAWEGARWLDGELIGELETLTPLAPNHLPQALATIAATRRAWPALPQVACSDSSFHRTLPDAARRFGLPRGLAQGQGIERYGYHGLAFESILSALEKPWPARIVMAHLGNGCSITAVRDGRSVDTTQGFTPLGGMLMATRPGDLDPGVPLHLLRQCGYTPSQLGVLLYQESGLTGLAGTGDMRALLADGSEAAAQAVAVFVHQARRFVGAMAASLGGVDLLVFSGGIGENSAPIRTRILEGMDWLSPAGKLAVRVVAVEEELVMARRAAAALRGTRKGG